MKILESSVPQISTFWYYNGTFIGDDIPYREAELYGDFLQNPNDHIDLWDSFKIILKSDKEYDYYPRGRVMMNTKIKKFIVVCDKCLLTNELKKEILYNFNLPKSTIFETDEHYKCKDCI